MAITVTPEEKVELARENTLIRELPGAAGSNRADYHNPVTGYEMSGPVDSYHMTRRLRQGWRLGPAPTELKAKWLVREQELKEEDDRRQEEFENSDEHKVNLNAQADRFNEAVATAVVQVLEKLKEEENEKPTSLREKEKEAQTEVDHQADFLQTVDAPAETGNKLQVPEASRPDSLSLVDTEVSASEEG